MLYFLVGSLGVVLGVVVSTIHHRKKTSIGALKVNTSDPDGPYLFLEVSNEQHLATITTKKQVMLDVKIVSQK